MKLLLTLLLYLLIIILCNGIEVDIEFSLTTNDPFRIVLCEIYAISHDGSELNIHTPELSSLGYNDDNRGADKAIDGKVRMDWEGCAMTKLPGYGDQDSNLFWKAKVTVPNGKYLTKFSVYAMSTANVAFSVNGQQVYVADNRQLYDIVLQQPVPALPAGQFTCLGQGNGVEGTVSTDLNNVLEGLRTHLDGSNVKNAATLVSYKEALDREIDDTISKKVGSNGASIRKALQVIQAFEAQGGLVFPFTKSSTTGNELMWAMIYLMQALVDNAYSYENVRKYNTLLGPAKFATADYFPGLSTAAIQASHTIQIQASCPKWDYLPVMYDNDHARHATGSYLPAGHNGASVVVPAALVNSGYRIRVGAHSWDLLNKPRFERMDRVTITYDITCTEMHIASPLGGAIYLEVPSGANAGIVDITIKNAARSPFYSKQPWHQTSTADWEIEKNFDSPWVDFESQKFFLQVPVEHLPHLEDPVVMMDTWDLALDGISEMFGYPLVRPKHVAYGQIDVIYRGGANYPGYPMGNYPCNAKNMNACGHRWFLKGGQFSSAVTFHELGHAQLFTKFPGERESVVNLLYAYYQGSKFGTDIETAFTNSMDWDRHMTMDMAAVQWFTHPKFQNAEDQDFGIMAYQHRGHLKYVTIAKLFGWDSLSRFWTSVNEDYRLRGISYPRNSDPIDNRILRMSIAADRDLTPIIHLLGFNPKDPPALKADMQTNNIKASYAASLEILRLKSLVPQTNAEFRQHALAIYKNREPNPESNNGQEQLYAALWNDWGPELAATTTNRIQAIYDTYFKDLNPEDYHPQDSPPTPEPTSVSVITSGPTAPNVPNSANSLSPFVFTFIYTLLFSIWQNFI